MINFFKPIPKPPVYAIISTITGLLVSLVIIFYFYPDPFFPHVMSNKHYTIRSREPINPRIQQVLDKATQRMQRSEINQPDLQHNIYLIEDFTAARFWGFQSIGALGWNTLYSKYIFIVKTDINRDLCFSEAYDQRGLSEIISHEITHSLQVKNTGLLNLKKLPKWKIEGYAEYVCTDVDWDTAKAQLAAIKNKTDYGSDYIRYRIAVSYLVLFKKFDWEQLKNTSLTLDELLAEIEKN